MAEAVFPDFVPLGTELSLCFLVGKAHHSCAQHRSCFRYAHSAYSRSSDMLRTSGMIDPIVRLLQAIRPR
jgi:hypothetical protein